MASKSNLPPLSTWDQEDVQLQADGSLSPTPDTPQLTEQNDSSDESLSEDDGDDELYGLLQMDYSAVQTRSPDPTATASATDQMLSQTTADEDEFDASSSPLPSPASLLDDLALPQLHIHPSARAIRKRTSSQSTLHSRSKRTVQYLSRQLEHSPLTK